MAIIEIEAKVKRWGNSFAVIIPSEIVIKEGIKENDIIRVIIIKDNSKNISLKNNLI